MPPPVKKTTNGLGEFTEEESVAIEDGGTGATTAEGARENLSVYSRIETDEMIGSSGSTMIHRPTITESGGTLHTSYSTSATYAGEQTGSIWRVWGDLEKTNPLAESTEGNLLSYSPSGLPPSTEVFAEVQQLSAPFSSLFSSLFSYTTSSAYTEAPTITVEGSPNDVPDDPHVTVSEGERVGHDETITSVTIRVYRVSDENLVYDTTKTDSFTGWDLVDPLIPWETSTEYRVECHTNSGNYQSGTTVAIVTTKSNFYVTPVEGGYASGDRRAVITITGDFPADPNYSTDWKDTIDGNVVHSLASNAGNNSGKYIEFDFGEEVLVSKIIMKREDTNENPWFHGDISVSSDGVEYITVATGVDVASGSVAGVETVISSPLAGRMLRLTQTSTDSASLYVDEFEFE